MDIGCICQHRVDTVRPEEPARAAAQHMATRSVGRLVVVDGRERPVGMLADRDLELRALAAGVDARTTALRDVMTDHAETLAEDASLEDALAAMRVGGVRRLPVVGGDGSLVGVVTLDDVVARLARKLGVCVTAGHTDRRASRGADS
jgi:CBS domain-containing protein